MKKMLFLLSLWLLSVSFAYSSEVVRLSNGEWPPYLSQKLYRNGAASHIIEEAFGAVGVTVEYVFRPWKRSYFYAKEGIVEGQVCHGTVVWVHTEERAESFFYSDPVIEDIEVLFYLKKKPLSWTNIDDLQGKVVGGTAHTTYPLFEEAEKKSILSILRAGNYDTLFQRLLAERIDAVPQVKQVGRFFLRNSMDETNRKQITFSPTISAKRQYHVLFSRKGDSDKHFLNLFNQGMEIIRDNGVYGRIISDLDDGKYF